VPRRGSSATVAPCRGLDEPRRGTHVGQTAPRCRAGRKKGSGWGRTRRAPRRSRAMAAGHTMVRPAGKGVSQVGASRRRGRGSRRGRGRVHHTGPERRDRATHRALRWGRAMARMWGGGRRAEGRNGARKGGRRGVGAHRGRSKGERRQGAARASWRGGRERSHEGERYVRGVRGERERERQFWGGVGLTGGPHQGGGGGGA
jgi:hypothetical protein